MYSQHKDVEMHAVHLTPADIESFATEEPYKKPAFRWLTIIDSGLSILWILAAIMFMATIYATDWAQGSSFVRNLAVSIASCIYFLPIVRIAVSSVALFQFPKWGYSSARSAASSFFLFRLYLVHLTLALVFRIGGLFIGGDQRLFLSS
jgi:hypothetical protein